MAAKSDNGAAQKQKVGSSRSAAEHFAGAGDFGIPPAQIVHSRELPGGINAGPGVSRNETADSSLERQSLMSADIDDDAAAGEISQGEAAGDDNTDVDNLS